MIGMPDGSYCVKCRYCLAGLAEPRCPECGWEFDPGNPRTFGDSARVPPRWPWVLAWVAIAYPALPLGALLASHSVAALCFGHIPRLDVDEPKWLNLAVHVLRGLSLFLLSLTVVAIVLNLLAIICVSSTSPFEDRLRRTLQCFAISLIAWCTWIALSGIIALSL